MFRQVNGLTPAIAAEMFFMRRRRTMGSAGTLVGAWSKARQNLSDRGVQVAAQPARQVGPAVDQFQNIAEGCGGGGGQTGGLWSSWSPHVGVQVTAFVVRTVVQSCRST